MAYHDALMDEPTAALTKGERELIVVATSAAQRLPVLRGGPRRHRPDPDEGPAHRRSGGGELPQGRPHRPAAGDARVRREGGGRGPRRSSTPTSTHCGPRLRATRTSGTSAPSPRSSPCPTAWPTSPRCGPTPSSTPWAAERAPAGRRQPQRSAAPTCGSTLRTRRRAEPTWTPALMSSMGSPALGPAAEAALEVGDVGVAHVLHGLGRQRGAAAAGAVEDVALLRVERPRGSTRSPDRPRTRACPGRRGRRRGSCP